MYKLVKKYIQKVDKTEIVFYELKIDDVKEALCETYKTISNDSWVQKLTDEALKQSYSSSWDYDDYFIEQAESSIEMIINPLGL